MAHLNMASIMKKVNAYAASSEGKARVAQTINEHRKNGSGKLASGDYIVTEQDMSHAAEFMIKTLQEVAFRNSLPESVREHFNSLYYSNPTPIGRDGSQYSVVVKFGDNLSRMSLKITSGERKGERTGKGIEDIVSLFNTGYNAEKAVRGSWDGHGDGTISSLTHREPLNFIEEAIDTFNRQYGKKYNVYAYASTDYA